MRRSLLLLLLLSCANTTTTNTIIFDNGASFEVELAQTPEQHAQGLMNRDKMDENKGMLFIFDAEETHTFWMKNTKIPLDIIFMNENRTVVEIYEAEPCASDSCPIYSANAQYVLEINGGLAKTKSITKGSRAVWSS